MFKFLVLHTLLDILLVSIPSLTHAFAPVLCSPTCSSGDPYLQLAWYFCDDEWCGAFPTTNANTQGDGFVQTGTPPSYINNIDSERTLYANAYVRGLKLFSTDFQTENGYDYVKLRQLSTSTFLTGTMPPNTWTTPALTSTLQSYPLLIRFVSDASVTDVGFKFSKASVCCDPEAVLSLPADVVLGKRNTGLLIGPSDVVYFSVPDAPTGSRTNLAMWSYTGTNFDMKVRCNSFPTATTWDAQSTSGDNYEFISLQSLGCTKLYVAVYNASSVTGYFNFVASQMKESMVKEIRAGYEGNWPADVGTEKANALKAMKRYYGATEGQHLIRSIEWFANTGTNCTNKCGGKTCDLCIKADSGFRAINVGGPCAGSVRLSSKHLDVGGHTLAHEWGHRYFCVKDEYIDLANTTCLMCGHSIMNGPIGTSLYNFCVDTADFHDHAEDQDFEPECSGIWHNGSWQAAPVGANLVTLPTMTPDVYNYESHDFNDYIFNY